MDTKDSVRIGGIIVVGAGEADKAILLGRDAFIAAYCSERGWSKADLSFQQILEIRAQDGWKNPASGGSNA